MKRIAAVGVVAAALVGAGASSAFAATAASTGPATKTAVVPSTCAPAGADDAWPGWADGNPGRSPGVTVWHDAQSWHVRVTHNTLHDRVFAGEILTSGQLVDVSAVRLERNDTFTVGAGMHSIKFRFNNYGGVDGFDFSTHCAPFLEFGFVSDGHIVRPARISIGAAAHHPASDPFLIRRTA